MLSARAGLSLYAVW